MRNQKLAAHGFLLISPFFTSCKSLPPLAAVFLSLN
jgi:hypothetical protein